MLTRGDLSQIKIVVQETLRPEIDELKQSTKKDMKGLETRLKGDMKDLEKRLIDRIDDAEMEIIKTVDEHKADRTNVDILEKRVERLEDNAGLPPYPNQ
jgi:ubiquinone biosynthesis protein UbiJ